MKIVHISAVYREWPIHLVVQTDTEEFLELSLTELKNGDFESLGINGWRSATTVLLSRRTPVPEIDRDETLS